MPPLIIDVTRLLYRRTVGHLPTGVDRVSLEYVRHYRRSARAVLQFKGMSAVLSARDSAEVFDWILDPAGTSRRRSLVRVLKAGVTGRFGPGVHGHYFFNTGHSGLQHASYAGSLRRRGVRPIFVVHDLIPISHPEYCRPGECDRHRNRMRHALAYGHGIIANSSDTLGRLERFAAAIGLALPPAVVAHLAPGLGAHVIGRRPLDQPYCVMLGTIEPRKNHAFLLQVWRALIERLGAAAPQLVLIGQRGWESENAVDLLERCETLRGHVTQLPSCGDAELATWLQYAQALVFPSLAEGFGLPVLEALSLGVPVLASDLAVFREFAGDIPEYLDPLDGPGWREAIADYARPFSSRRAAQMERARAFRPPQWSRHLAVVDGLLERLDRSA